MKRTKSLRIGAVISLIILATSFPSQLYSQQQNLPDVIKSVQDSVVNIQTDREFLFRNWSSGSFIEQFFEDFAEDKSAPPEKIKCQSEGSGVILDAAGLILTNEHVISGAQTIRVILNNKQSVTATVVGKNQKQDLALLQIENDQTMNLKPITLGDSETVNTGQDVFAIGTPYGYSQTVTRGIVSAVHREYKEGNEVLFKDLIQTDASVNPGNSGGPLLNMKGEMVGLINLRERRAQGIGFAIPINQIKTLISELKTGQDQNLRITKFQSRFGFTPKESKNENGQEQILIAEVLPRSAAFKAGIKPNDILHQFQNKRVSTLEELIEEANKVHFGQRVYLRIGKGKRIYFTYIEAN